MNQRIILIFVTTISLLATIAINEVSALKDKDKWFDARNFYKEIDKMDMFDMYPYGEPTIKVNVEHVGDKDIKRDFIVQYGKETQFLSHKEFKKDDKASIKFYVQDGEKRKICMMSYHDEYQKCKKFKSFDDKNVITFYIQ